MTLQRCRACNAHGVAQAMRAVVLAVPLLMPLGCASNPAQSGYQAFLQKIAVECRPLIIGADDMGQAIVYNGLGAIPVNYTNFLSMTSALYAGTITPDTYRASLDSFVGTGSNNRRSFDCIIGHLPAAPPAPAH